MSAKGTTINLLSERRRLVFAAVIVIAVGAVFVSCRWARLPVIAFGNLDILQLLGTAVSARNPEWIERVSQAIDQRERDELMSDGECASLRRIIALAASQEWEEADAEYHALAEAQLHRRRAPAAADLPARAR